MKFTRKEVIKEFMMEYKLSSRLANNPDFSKSTLYYELRGFYNGITRLLSHDNDMPFTEYRLIYMFMLRKLDIFYRVYVMDTLKDKYNMKKR